MLIHGFVVCEQVFRHTIFLINFTQFIVQSHIGVKLIYKKMKTIETKKLNYLRPTISVCNILEESFILAASPTVRPGGDNKGSVTVEPLVPVHDDNDDELFG